MASVRYRLLLAPEIFLQRGGWRVQSNLLGETSLAERHWRLLVGHGGS
jgi:hypothetical protein